MWIPVKLIVKNLKSFVYQEYMFQKGAFLIQGINKTDSGSSSNGSGKSTLQIAICYVLDLPIPSTSLTDLINDQGAKKCEVEFTLKNEKLNQELVITKETPLKSSSKLKVILNDEDQSDKFATVPEGHKFIISLIGISKEDLINHYIISKEKYKSFFSSSDREVKELIGRFSNFNRIDGVEKIVEADVNELEGDVRLGESNLSKLQGKIELLQEQLEKEQNIDVEFIKNENIDNLTESIVANEDTIQNSKKQIIKTKEEIEAIKQQITTEKAVLKAYEEEFDVLKELNYEKEITALNEDKKGVLLKKVEVGEVVQEFNINLKAYNKFKMEVETSIEGSIECPKCLHEFIPNEEVDIEEAKKALPEILDEIKAIEANLTLQATKLDDFDKSINGFNEKVQEYDAKVTKFADLKRAVNKKIFNKESDINQLNTNIQFKEVEIVNKNNSIKQTESYIEQAKQGIIEAKEKAIETKEKEIKENIDKLAKEVLTKEDEIQTIKDKQFELNQWALRFNKFKSHLANESLDIIGGYANMYLEKMKTNLNIQLEGYRTNKDGSVREKITPIVLRDGIQEGTGNLKKFSGGEKGKIDFAVSVLALQGLINNTCSTGGFSLLFVDEITEGLDSLGIENLAKSIDELEKYCLIVSHVPSAGVYNNIVMIEKVGGVSRILN